MNTVFCFSCMNPISSPESLCPHCGHDNHIRDNGPGLLSGGTLAGKYIVGRLLGRGGFGATYMGYDTFLQRRVAIKEYFPTNLVMRDDNSSNLSIISGGAESFAKGKERALRESRMAAGLGSVPGIVQIHDVLSANNTIYIVMEYVEGDTLTRYVEKQPEKLSLSRAMALMGQVAAALSALHHRKVIHRDVKPDNIIIRKDPEQGVLLDFGAAKVDDGTTMSNSSAVVSPGFAPPEQYNAASLDGRIDQYAFAATLYYMLTGQRPTDSIMRMVSGTPLPSIHQLNPAVPEAAEKVIMKGMAVKDGERYGSMEEFWGALEKAAGKMPPKPKPVPTPSKGKKGLIGLIAGIGLALIALLLVFALPKKECEHEWVPGTCLTVKHCAKCNATVADGFGAHVWQEATCENPKTCSVCNTTEGSVLGHNWKDATCTTPKTCSSCGVTEGKAAGHLWQDNTCTVCNAKKDTSATHAPVVTAAPASNKPKGKSAIKRSVYEITPEEMTKLQKDLIRLGYLGDEFSDVNLAQYITDDPNVRIPEEISAAILLFEMDTNIPLGKNEGGKPTKEVVDAADDADENEEPYNIRRGARYLQRLGYLSPKFDLISAVTSDGTAHTDVEDALQQFVEAKKQEKLLDKRATYIGFSDDVMDLLYSDYQVAICETPIMASVTEVKVIPVTITSATEADAVDVNGVPCFSKPCDLTITGTANPGTIINAYYMLSDDDGNTNEYSARKEVQVDADGTWSMTFDADWVAETFEGQSRAGILFEDANDIVLEDIFVFNYDFRSHEISNVSFTKDRKNLYMAGKTEPSVSVVETGSQIGTLSDGDGNFQLTLPGMMDFTELTFQIDGDELHLVNIPVTNVKKKGFFPFW